ncbi:hypothetical protein LVJ94_07735 [Pendulispora rubella]|uniref:Lipoprotein n=1 Tax=Pendulispora rubella TaxID=2741070 RepID=A0ABZ2LC36_9BACT
MKSAFGSRLGCAAAVFLVMAGAGCASSSSLASGPADPSATKDGLSVWFEGGGAVTASVDPEGNIFGAVVNVHRSRTAPQAGPGAPSGSSDSHDDSGMLQGSVYDRPVNITFRGASARGLYGKQPFNLDVEDAPGGVLRVRGLAGGAPLDFEISPTKWTGHVGGCGYDLAGRPWHYEGFRACGGRSQRVRVEVGKPISDWASIDTVTLLGLVLRR